MTSPTTVLRAVRTARELGAFDPTSPFVMAAAMARTGPSTALPYVSAALRFPMRPAVVDDYGSLTYHGLARRIEQLADALRRLGLGPADRIGILCRNHRGFVEINAGIGRIGAVPVYLNTSFGRTQLRKVIERESVSAVFHDAEFADELAKADTQRFVVAPEQDAGWSFPDLPPHCVVMNPPVRRPAASVLLTSGTTGTPKGATRDPRHTGPAALGAVLTLPHRRGARTVLAAPLFHAWGLAQLSLASVYAQTVVLRRHFDPERTLADLGSHKADTLIAVPVMLRRLIDAAPDGDEFITRHLRLTASSGSALTGGLATAWMDRFGDNLHNFYGSTEVGHVAVATPDDLRRAPDTAGRPPPGAEVLVLDEAGRPVGPGTSGRITVRNGAHFDGYTGGGSKPTIGDFMEIGDVGFFDDDGLLYVTGRVDDMIISGSENLFPLEIEEYLLRRRGVVDAAVIGVPDEEFGQVLHAVVVAAPGVEIDTDALRRSVARNLATFKAPKRIAVVDEIPRNATGKIRRDQVRRLLRAR